MAFTVKTAYYSGGIPAWTEATESNAIDYKVRWVMNRPSEAQIILNDVNFASLQKYTVTSGDVYYGKWSYALIEDPTNTEIFRGPIVKVMGNRDGTVTLFAKDWLHQLDRERIDYDTRLDLGSGKRESHFQIMDAATPRTQHIDWVGGVETACYDDTAAWDADDFNGDYLVFNTSKMGGSGSIWLPMMAENAAVGNETGGYEDTLYQDENYYEVVSAAAGGDIDFTLSTYTFIPEAKVTQIDLDLWICTGSDQGGTDCIGPVVIRMWDFDAGADTPEVLYSNAYWGGGYDFDQDADATGNVQQLTFTDVATKCSTAANTVTNQDLIDSTGEIRLVCDFPVDAGDQGTLQIYYARWTIHYADVTPVTTVYTIDDTGSAATGDWLEFSENLETAGIDKHAPYSITKVLTHWVADLVTSYDDQQTIDAASDLTASTNKLARHYRLMTPLEILQDFAEVDNTEFWLDRDFDLHWNSTYATGGAPTITDSSVLYWMSPHVDDAQLANDVYVLGATYSDYQIAGTSTDAGSQTDFGVYTQVIHDRDIYHEAVADTIADSIKDRKHDGRLYAGYAENGLTSRVLGEVIEIQSTDLALNAGGGGAAVYYIVTEIQYGHNEGVSRILLTPRHTAGINVKLGLPDLLPDTQRTIAHAVRNIESTPRHTETWS